MMQKNELAQEINSDSIHAFAWGAYSWSFSKGYLYNLRSEVIRSPNESTDPALGSIVEGDCKQRSHHL